MQKRSLIFLATAAMLALLGAIWTTASQQAVTDTQTDVSLVPDLLKNVNEIDRIEVRSADDSVTLLRGESGWTVSEKGGYPANMQNLRKQLIAMAEARIIEPKTANPDNYSRIGVGDVATGSDSVSIKMDGPGTAVDLLVGKQNYRGQASTYVRRAGEEQSYLVSGSLKMDSKPSAWLLKDIFNVGSPRMQRVVLQHADGSTLEIVKSQQTDPNFAVLSIPAGRELASPGAGNAVAGALGSMRLEDVEPVAEEDAEGAEVVEGIFETFDGLRITTRAWKLEDNHYLALSVAYDESLVPETEVDAEDEAEAEQTAPGELILAAPEPADADAVDHALEATEMQATVADWVYVIPSYKYNNMTKTVYDLLKPLPVELPDSDE